MYQEITTRGFCGQFSGYFKEKNISYVFAVLSLIIHCPNDGILYPRCIQVLASFRRKGEAYCTQLSSVGSLWCCEGTLQGCRIPPYPCAPTRNVCTGHRVPPRQPLSEGDSCVTPARLSGCCREQPPEMKRDRQTCPSQNWQRVKVELLLKGTGRAPDTHTGSGTWPDISIYPGFVFSLSKVRTRPCSTGPLKKFQNK